jgi:hypothetical protein
MSFPAHGGNVTVALLSRMAASAALRSACARAPGTGVCAPHKRTARAPVRVCGAGVQAAGSRRS